MSITTYFKFIFTDTLSESTQYIFVLVSIEERESGRPLFVAIVVKEHMF